jgi:ectoine hydroxylase-related dioxygenase (phytanoyl-CoA dioxygenase family)
MSVSFNALERNFKEWGEFFHKNGYIILNNALNQEQIHDISKDLDILESRISINKKKKLKGNHVVHKCFFENSRATVDLVESGVLIDFTQYLIGDVPGSRGNGLFAHLIHNNAFIVPPNGRGQAPTYHMDDMLQNVIIPENGVLPENIKLPVMLATWMIWLSDCSKPENGPTYVVPGSHRFGRPVDAKLAEELGIPACGNAGTAVLVNNQLWHRGCQNRSLIPRKTLQLTFGRRIIGHKFKSIMNYQLPEHVLRNRTDPELFKRFGFLEGGAYS